MERISRLSKQKKIWREKLIRTVNRRIFDLKELKRVKAEKAVRSSNAKRQTVYIVGQKSVGPEDPLDPNNWFFPSDFALSFDLLIDLGILRNVEISPDIQSSF